MNIVAHRAKPHLDTLRVVHGHAFPVAAAETIRLGSPALDLGDDAWAFFNRPAGRGA